MPCFWNIWSTLLLNCLKNVHKFLHSLNFKTGFSHQPTFLLEKNTWAQIDGGELWPFPGALIMQDKQMIWLAQLSGATAMLSMATAAALRKSAHVDLSEIGHGSRQNHHSVRIWTEFTSWWCPMETLTSTLTFVLQKTVYKIFLCLLCCTCSKHRKCAHSMFHSNDAKDQEFTSPVRSKWQAQSLEFNLEQLRD